MSTVVSVVNQKGGVAKTLTVNSLSHELAKRGYKVLAIDGDTQADLTFSLGFSEKTYEEGCFTLTNAMLTAIENALSFDSTKEFDIHDALIKVSDNFDLLPTTIDMAVAELRMISITQREFLIYNIIEPLLGEYDYIIIDCPPALSIMTINLLTASDGVLIPANADSQSLRAMQSLVATIGNVKRSTNPDLEVYGLLFTDVQINTSMAKAFMEATHTQYGKAMRIYDTYIPHSVSAKEAVSENVSVIDYQNGKTTVAKAYKEFTDEFLKEVSKHGKEN